jgi:hypothetical protein
MLDPDRWSYLALMGTASPLQVPAMRGLLSRYLKFEPFFGVRIPVSISRLGRRLSLSAIGDLIRVFNSQMVIKRLNWPSTYRILCGGGPGLDWKIIGP